MTTTSPAARAAASPAAPRTSSSAPVWRAGAAAAALATVANLALYALAGAAGVPLLVRLGADAVVVTTPHVVLASLVPLAAAASRRSGAALRVVRSAAALATVASLAGPLAAGAGPSAKLTLAAMHVVAGGAFLAATTTGRVRRGYR